MILGEITKAVFNVGVLGTRENQDFMDDGNCGIVSQEVAQSEGALAISRSVESAVIAASD